MKIGVIEGSIREGRKGAAVTQWVLRAAQDRAAEQTIAWVTTLCTGVAPIQELSNLDTSGQDPATAQKTGVDALTKFGTVLSDTSEKLASAEPPTF